MHVLHAAKKYQLLSLAKVCVKYLGKELRASNACSILEHSRFFEETELAKKCLKKIEENTPEALECQDVMDVSRETLITILDSTDLSMDEDKIFERCYDWAFAKRQGNETVRDVLGDALFKIRFPLMAVQRFTDIMTNKHVLTPHEQVEILKVLNSPNNSMKGPQRAAKKSVQV